MFGIEDSIVLGTWDLERTFFDYKLSSYDTNFGIPGYIGQQGFPELHYNIVVKRKFENAFILYLLPLFLVAALLFAALMTVSANEGSYPAALVSIPPDLSAAARHYFLW